MNDWWLMRHGKAEEARVAGVFSSAFGALERFVAFALNEKRLARDLPEGLQEDARWHDPATIVNRDCWERIRSAESFGW